MFGAAAAGNRPKSVPPPGREIDNRYADLAAGFAAISGRSRAWPTIKKFAVAGWDRGHGRRNGRD